MNDDGKKPDSHVAFGAAVEGVAALASSVVIVGRYWWNAQMQLLLKIGVMPSFKTYPWLFVIVAFLLLAFLFPIGIAFVISAFCAGEMNPKAKDNFIVPLRRIEQEKDIVVDSGSASIAPSQTDQNDLEDPDSWRDYIYDTAGIYHLSFVNSIKRDLDNLEFAAAALGAFDGTVQAFEINLTDLEMMAMGSAFMLRQVKDFGRLNDTDLEKIADFTAEVMTSDALQEIREQAGRVAYTMHMAQK